MANAGVEGSTENETLEIKEENYKETLRAEYFPEGYKQHQIQASEEHYLSGLLEIRQMFRNRKRHPVPGNDSYDDKLNRTIEELKAKKAAFSKRVHIDNNEEPEIFRDD